ncbi:hypothetical protein J6590_049286 [Homalodisca vitripennis]|nr:hypothetical protein J6590_049286 [Homalodisca vitripennis]
MTKRQKLFQVTTKLQADARDYNLPDTKDLLKDESYQVREASSVLKLVETETPPPKAESLQVNREAHKQLNRLSIRTDVSSGGEKGTVVCHTKAASVIVRQLWSPPVTS